MIAMTALLWGCGGQPAKEADKMTVTDPKPLTAKPTPAVPAARIA